jgi:hypothetical protein
MNFYLYLFLCYITHPFRMLMPKYRHEHFAIRLLFWNEYKCLFVTSQAEYESGHYSSALYNNAKNCFGMAKTDHSKYQNKDDFYQSAKTTEPHFAYYKNSYYSVYDYYDCIRNRVPKYGQALNKVPSESLSHEEKNYTAYLQDTANAYHAAGYFTAAASVYGSGLISIAETFTNTVWRYVLNWTFCICMPLLVYILVLSSKASEYRKKLQKAFTIG